MEEKFRRYDITIIKRINNNEFKVYAVYPNEDNGCLTPVVWESHHYWDGKGTIQDFMDIIEDRAYLHEDLKSLEEVFSNFEGQFIFFNSESDIERNLVLIPIGQNAIWFNIAL